MTTSNVTCETDLVIAKEVGDKGILELNRNDSLNALNYEMVQKMATYIKKWQHSKSLILIKSKGEKAFSAGVDLMTTIAADDPYEAGRKVCRSMYPMNYMIATLRIPYVALINGTTVGGAAGISVHGTYRIATERTVFAMPEASIGTFIDCGASYFLPKLQSKLGYYLALTGHRLRGEDVWHAGIATHYCDSVRIPKIEKNLIALGKSNEIEAVLDELCPKPKSEFNLLKYLDKIEKVFSASSIEEILSNLESDNTDWAKQTIKDLRLMSPTTLKVTLRLLNLGADSSLEECLQMEYCLTLNYLRGLRTAHFVETEDPKWNPPRIEDVTEEKVLSYFHPLPENEQLPELHSNDEI